jgi:glutamine cyclotransferase
MRAHLTDTCRLRWLLSRRSLAVVFLLPALLLVACGCSRFSAYSRKRAAEQRKALIEAAESGGAPDYTFQIVNTYPHDPTAFTQGLIYQDDVLFESTGLNGRSTQRRVVQSTRRVVNKVDVSQEYFAEGITLFDGKIFQLTWHDGKGFIYDPANFRRTGEFAYEGEGWGLTHDDRSLILSDGTNKIRFLNPVTFAVERTISVLVDGKPLDELNELEYIKGEIYANIWQTDKIVRIDPSSGKILGWIDLTDLLPVSDRGRETNVLNGIAYDRNTDRLFVTGKLWPKLFEIKLKRK